MTHIVFAIILCWQGKERVNLNNGAEEAKLNGLVVCKDESSGKVQREIQYKNGKRHGVEKMIGFDDRRHETTYENGIRSGLTRDFDKDGRLESESTYRNDRELGPSKRFHKNGKIAVERDRKDKDVETISKHYDEDGHLTQITCGTQVEMQVGRAPCKYGDRSETITTFHKSGRPKERIKIVGGLREGKSETLYESGKLAEEEWFKQGKLDGVASELAENGKPKKRITFSAGEKSGTEETFFDDGSLSEKIEWKDHEQVFHQKNYRNGKAKQIERRTKDRFIEEEFFDTGKPARYEEFSLARRGYGGRQRHGASKSYWESGSPQRETTYADGKLDGTESNYDDKGKLRTRDYYKAGTLTKRETYDETGKHQKTEEFYEDGSRK